MSEMAPSTVLPPPELDADSVLASQLRFGAHDNNGPYKQAVNIDPVDNPNAFLDAAINAMGSYQSPERPDRHEEKDEEAIRAGDKFFIGLNATGEPRKTRMALVSKEQATVILETAVGSIALRSYMEGMDELSKPVSTPASEETRPRPALPTEAPLEAAPVVSDNDEDGTEEYTPVADTKTAPPDAIVLAEGVIADEVVPQTLTTVPSTTELTPSNEASLVEPPKNVDESVVDGRIHEGSSNDGERKNDIALREVANKYGFEEGDSAEYVITELESALYGLDDMLDFHSKSVKQELTEAIYSIKKTLQGRGVVYFAGRKREPTREILFGNRSFRRKVSKMDTTHLSKATKSHIEYLNRQLIQAGSAFEDATRRGSDFIVHEPADMLSKLLGRINDVDPLSKEAKALRQDINDLRIMQGMSELEVSAKTGKDAESLDGEVEFRNEQVKAWADELKQDGMSEERRDEIARSMENAILLESGMDGDPNSPRMIFGDRVIANQEKQARAPRVVDGKTVYESKPTQRLVAEVMADMLAGKYNVEKSNDRVITVDATGRAVTGQGRAAALAMIYGTKEWQNEARKLGLEVNKV
jgi:hypothetical protein